MPRSSLRPSRLARVDVLVIAAALAVAALLTIPFLRSTSLWYDEGYSLAFARLSWPNLWLAIHHVDAVFVLYYAIMHALIHIGSDVFALRLFSTVCFLASLPVGYGIARRLFGSMAAIVVVALLASNAFLIVHAREVRPYTLAFLFALLATWFAVVLVERPRLSTAAAFVACAAVAVLAHAISALYLAGLFVSLGVLPGSKRGRIACALAFGALAVVLVPFLALLHGVGSSQVDWIARPRIADVGHVIFALAGGRIGEIAGVLSVVVLIVMSRTARVRVVPVIWFATPLVLIVVFSYAVHPALISRYLIALVFPLARHSRCHRSATAAFRGARDDRHRRRIACRRLESAQHRS